MHTDAILHYERYEKASPSEIPLCVLCVFVHFSTQSIHSAQSSLSLRSNRRPGNRVRPRRRPGSTWSSTRSPTRRAALAEETLLLRVAPRRSPRSSLSSLTTRRSITPPPIFPSAVRNIRKPAAADVLIFARASELLRERRALAQHRAFPVDDVDGDDEDEADASQDRAGVLQVVAGLSADVGEEGGGGDGQDTGEEVARPAVAACG